MAPPFMPPELIGIVAKFADLKTVTALRLTSKDYKYAADPGFWKYFELLQVGLKHRSYTRFLKIVDLPFAQKACKSLVLLTNNTIHHDLELEECRDDLIALLTKVFKCLPNCIELRVRSPEPNRNDSHFLACLYMAVRAFPTPLKVLLPWDIAGVQQTGDVGYAFLRLIIDEIPALERSLDPVPASALVETEFFIHSDDADSSILYGRSFSDMLNKMQNLEKLSLITTSQIGYNDDLWDSMSELALPKLVSLTLSSLYRHFESLATFLGNQVGLEHLKLRLQGQCDTDFSVEAHEFASRLASSFPNLAGLDFILTLAYQNDPVSEYWTMDQFSVSWDVKSSRDDLSTSLAKQFHDIAAKVQADQAKSAEKGFLGGW